MSIHTDNLLRLSPDAIPCKPIAVAVKAVHKLQEDAQKARRDLTHHEQVAVEKAKAKDTQAIAAARREGRAEPKWTHTATAEKRTAELDREARVAVELAQRAHADLAAAVAEHGDAFAAEVREALESNLSKFREGVNWLIPLLGDLESTASVARVVVGTAPNVGAVSVPAKMIHDLEIAPGQRNPHGVLLVPDLLDRLSRHGMPPEPSAQEPAEPAPPPLRGVGLNASNTREHLERKALAQAMTANPTPDERPTLADDAVTAITPAELAASRRDLPGDNDE
jgi:hypothetical protein